MRLQTAPPDVRRHRESGIRSAMVEPGGAARVRSVTKPAANNRSKADNLFDHVVGTGEQGRRDFEAEHFCGLEIDGEPILRGSLHL